MILTKDVLVNINNKNVSFYKQKGYKDIKRGDRIAVKVEHLPDNSKQKVKVQCDICGNEKEVTYISYFRNINKYDYYCCSTICSNEKRIKTNINKYGVEHPNQLEDNFNKIKNTKKERYNNPYYNNIEKQKNTNLERYGKESYMLTDEFRKKSERTNLERYKNIFPQKSLIIKEKTQKTNLQKYGFITPLMNENVKNKSKNTKNKRYNDQYYNNRELYRKTCKDKFGNDNPMQNDSVKESFKEKFLKKYNVSHPSQVEEFYKKCLKSGYKIKNYKNTDLYYQGTYELDFLNKYYDKITIERGKTIRYHYNGEDKIYFSDFYIPVLNLLVEIKSKQWYETHLEKNLEKEKACKERGYNFIFIIDKNYNNFNKMIQPYLYNKTHSYQYDIRQKTLKDDVKKLNFDYTKLKVSDFNFRYIQSTDKYNTKRVVDFIEKYEWLGKMPNRPTHRFICEYNGILAGVVVMSTPNGFSKLMGENTKDIEKLISRGACAGWTPKNLASSLIMFSIKWMVKHTQFRLFSAYGDEEAKEIGTIYQACNFYYLGKKYGSSILYFDPLNPEKGWVTHRMFSKLNTFKKYLREEGIKWDNNWNQKTSILWEKIPEDVVKIMKKKKEEHKSRCLTRQTSKKHKYVYIMGKNNSETKYLRNKFKKLNKNLIKSYPKRIYDKD